MALNFYAPLWSCQDCPGLYSNHELRCECGARREEEYPGLAKKLAGLGQTFPIDWQEQQIRNWDWLGAQYRCVACNWEDRGFDRANFGQAYLKHPSREYYLCYPHQVDLLWSTQQSQLLNKYDTSIA